jgi:hypothetical protein
VLQAPHTRVVLLTVFRKSRQVERAEVMRAIAAQQTCELGHEEHEARAALLLGQMVYDRRTELGLTQGERAERADMTQPQLSRLE